MDWYIKVLQNYVGFEGRAGRREFWTFTLINIAIGIAFTIFTSIVFWITGSLILSSILYGIQLIYGLGILLPSLAVGVRRLHDIGQSGWLILVGLIPIIGTIVLIILFVLESKPDTNEWGPNPNLAETVM